MFAATLGGPVVGTGRDQAFPSRLHTRCICASNLVDMNDDFYNREDILFYTGVLYVRDVGMIFIL